MLSPGIPAATYGSMANDNGHLLFDETTIEDARRDPVASRFIRPYVGATEMLNAEGRWCLWLAEATPSEIRSSPLIMERLRRVRDYRANSDRAATRAAAEAPHLFVETRPVTEDFLLIPYVSSEARRYVPMMFYSPDTIVRAPAWCIPGADLWLFGILQSAMFMAWVRTVSGRLKSDLQLSIGTIYNPFPFPVECSTRVREGIEGAASVLLHARSNQEGETLADIYNPLAMPRDLTAAHRALDRAVDAAFAPRHHFESDMERLRLLFERYERLRPSLRTGAARPRGARR